MRVRASARCVTLARSLLRSLTRLPGLQKDREAQLFEEQERETDRRERDHALLLVSAQVLLRLTPLLKVHRAPVPMLLPSQSLSLGH